MHTPLVSIITPSLNQGEFMEESIQSILKQTYKNWEHIVTDGLSSDKSIQILKKHPHIRWISEKDSGYWDAITKGVRLAKGKYIMLAMVSDGYLDSKWIERCVDILEHDSEVSLVWGLSRWLEGGKLTDVSFPYFRHAKVPQKFDWLYFWLMTGETLPNGNFCIRKSVFQKCNQHPRDRTKGRELVGFNYNFNTRGFLPYHIPIIADFGRTHGNQLTQAWNEEGRLPKAFRWYRRRILLYTELLKKHPEYHIFHDSNGKALPETLDMRNVNEFRSIMWKSKIFFYSGFERLKTKIVNRLIHSL